MVLALALLAVLHESHATVGLLSAEAASGTDSKRLHLATFLPGEHNRLCLLLKIVRGRAVR